MATDSSKALVLLLVVVLSAGFFTLLSKAQLFGLGLPEEKMVTACSGEQVELDGVRAELFRLHNEERSLHNAPPLCWSPELAAAATSHSEDMMERGFFDHDTPEGIEPSDRTLAAGYDSTFVAENIMIHHMSSGATPNVGDTQDIVTGWMESPGHRRNLLDPRLKEVGIGVSYGRFDYETEKSGTYTVNFGTPMEDLAAFSTD